MKIKLIKLLVLCLMGMSMLACSPQMATVPEVDEVKQDKKTNSKASALNVQLGLGYLRQGDTQRAKQKLLIALTQDKQSPDAVGAMAYFYEKTDDITQAKNYYLRALKLAPGKGPQLNNFGAFLCRQGQYAMAEKYFLSAVKDMNYINSAGALENAGLCALEIPNLKSAIAFFVKAITQDPKRYKSYIELAKLEMNVGHFKKVLDLVNQYQNYNALTPRLIFIGYNAAVAAKQPDKARNFSWILRTKFPESLESKKLLASETHEIKRTALIS